jgi:hypothetical protein
VLTFCCTSSRMCSIANGITYSELLWDLGSSTQWLFTTVCSVALGWKCRVAATGWMLL